MKTSVFPVNKLSDQLAADWASHLSDEGVLNNPFLRPEFAQFAGRVLPNVEVAALTDESGQTGYFTYERTSGDVGVPVGRFLSDLHGVAGPSQLAWSATDLIRDCGLKAWQFDHLVADQQPFLTHQSFQDPSYFMDLRKGYDAYTEQRKADGSSLIKQAARKARKLEREVGPIRFTAHTTEPAAWNALATWKGEQLTRLGYPDMFRLDWVNDLLAELRTVSEPKFSPLLSTLHAGDTLVAVHLGLRSPTVVDSWIPTYSSEFSRYSTGLLLQLELAQWAANEGVLRVDLGRGENQMKLALASDAFPVAIGAVDLRLLQRTWTRAYYGIRNIVHASPLRDASIKSVRRIRSWLS